MTDSDTKGGGSEPPLPEHIDVETAKEVTPPPAPPVRLDPLSKAGVALAKIVLGLIAGALLIFLGVMAVNEYYTPSYLQDAYTKSVAASLTDARLPNAVSPDTILAKILEARQAARDFWLKAAQLVLLNLLLPVLTAILGYIFGARQAAKAG